MGKLNNKLISIPIENLPATSSTTIKRLKSVGIITVWNLLNYFPFRYENYLVISPIAKVQSGETVSIKGKIIKVFNLTSKKGLKIQKLTLADESGKIDAVWYNQPYLLRILRIGSYVALAGEIKGFFNKISFEPKEYELLEKLNSPTVHTGRLVPIYPEKNGLSSRLLREKIFYLINHLGSRWDQDGIAEIFPAEIVKYNNLFGELNAYQSIHFPQNQVDAKKARERLAFDELFTIQLSAALIRKEWDKEQVKKSFKLEPSFKISLQNFSQNLPFQLTNAQNRSVKEIIGDLVKSRPMNRFLEGDVGSGKTVVAAIACYFSYLNGYQSLFMAPTEILASQHYQTLKETFTKLNLKIGLQTGSKKIIRKHKQKLEKLIKSIDYDIIVGTHALIDKKLQFDRIGLVIIDEQHRFGVVQRAKLKEKGLNPHLLTMTATPIPRTVALTLYGELDLSIIDEMPKGRTPIKTYLVPQDKRESGYVWIKKKIKEEKIQVFIICPLIEESEIETMKSIKAATKEYERLKQEIFNEYKLELLHGKIKSNDKDLIMKNFKEKKIDILVATPVVEVGIDIPNATIMLIEAAERFGLAQLHQLRGRVGRGKKQSYCILYTGSKDDVVIERLKFFAKTQSGMEVAEYDLKIRGPGEIYGVRQHGVVDLKVASLSDYQLIDKSKKAVNYFLVNHRLDSFFEIKRRIKEYNIKQITRD